MDKWIPVLEDVDVLDVVSLPDIFTIKIQS